MYINLYDETIYINNIGEATMEICLFHRDMDGYMSAVNIFFLEKNIETFIPVQYNEPILGKTLDKLSKGDKVFIVDFSLDDKLYLKLLSKGVTIVNYDHHKTKFERLKAVRDRFYNSSNRIEGTEFELYLDSSKAACQMIPSKGIMEPKRKFITQYVGDRDIGLLWDKTVSREEKDKMELVRYYLLSFLSVNDIINSVTEIDRFKLMSSWNEIIDKDNYFRMTTIGNSIKRFCTNKINSTIENAFKETLNGYECICVFNTDVYLNSEIGNILSNKYDLPVCVIVPIKTSEVLLIFRSKITSNNKIDALTIAKTYGGEGHKNASTSKVHMKDFHKSKGSWVSRFLKKYIL